MLHPPGAVIVNGVDRDVAITAIRSYEEDGRTACFAVVNVSCVGDIREEEHSR